MGKSTVEILAILFKTLNTTDDSKLFITESYKIQTAHKAITDG